MLRTNALRLKSVVLMIVLAFSLIAPRSDAAAKTVQEKPQASGVAYNVGDVFVSVGNGKVKHFNPQGILLDTLDTNTIELLEATSGMTFDRAGNLYVTNFHDDSVSKFDNQGNLLGPFASSELSAPESVLVDAAGNFYVGDAEQRLTSPPGRLHKYDANGTLLDSFVLEVENQGVDWIDLAAGQCTIFYTSEGKLIKRYNVCTRTQSPDFATLPISGIAPDDAAWALRIRTNGEVLVATSHAVFRLNSAGTVIQTYPQPAGETSHLFALTLDADLTSFWTAGYASGNVYKIDIQTGALLQSFNAGLDPQPGGGQVGGLVVYGELEARQPQLTLEPVTETRIVGETVEFAAFLTNCLSPNVTVTFTVTGANPQTGTGLATCDQIFTVFSYTGLNPGTDTVVATAHTSQPPANLTSNTSTITWQTLCPVLDDFNRPNGPLGSNWDGRTSSYRIRDNKVVVPSDGPIYWQPEAYGTDQEACVTLSRINPRSRQHALLLKVQELNDWRKGAILVNYNARSGEVEVKARDVINRQWILVGSFTPTTPLVDGDRLRAKAFADGTVEVLINDASIGTADAGSFYVDKGGQIGLWFRTPDIKRRAFLDDFGGGTVITTPPLTQISSDPFTNTTSQHKTEVEPDSFSNGSTIVSVQQSGRFFAGGASNICWSTLNNAGLVASGCLPGLTKFASPAGIFDRVSDPVVAFDAKHGVWLVSSLAVIETPSLVGKAVLISRSTDATATAWNNPVVVSEATGSSFYDKNWTACDNTPTSPFFGNCYTEWDDNGQGNLLQMSTSSDGGLTWGPKKTNGFHGLGGQPVVQPNGTVIVPYLNGAQILAFRSTDGGNSWSTSFLVSNVSSHDPAGNLRFLPLPSAEIDAAGKVYVVWADCRFRSGCTSNDIVMSTSTDGMSWTSVIRVPIGTTTDGVDQFIPSIAVDKTTSGTTAKVAITYYYYPAASCTFATCQLHVGFVSSPDGGANWTGVTSLTGPMTLSWLPNTSQGRMVGDYISTSYGSDGLAHGVFAVANEPTGDPDCAIATPNCDQAIYTTSSGLALVTILNAPEALKTAEVGIPQPPVPLNADEDLPDQTNLTRY